jgi:hypothetical protein
MTRQAVLVDEGKETGSGGQGMGGRLPRVEREAEAAGCHEARGNNGDRRPAGGSQTHLAQ